MDSKLQTPVYPLPPDLSAYAPSNGSRGQEHCTSNTSHCYLHVVAADICKMCEINVVSLKVSKNEISCNDATCDCAKDFLPMLGRVSVQTSSGVCHTCKMGLVTAEAWQMAQDARNWAKRCESGESSQQASCGWRLARHYECMADNLLQEGRVVDRRYFYAETVSRDGMVDDRGSILRVHRGEMPTATKVECLDPLMVWREYEFALAN